MLFQGTISNEPFRLWLKKDRENRILLMVFVPAVIVEFIIFKILYPFPNFMPPDSNSYLEAAFNNQAINFWAIGYSKFLRLFSSFTNSPVSLVWFQYLFLQFSFFYFLFTIKYLLSPGKWIFRILLGITALNPLFCHISNFVGSDTLFTGLSLIWMTQLFWILYRPEKRLLGWHAIMLCLTFMIRFNSLYYPIISLSAIVISRGKWIVKWWGIGWIGLLLGLFIGNTEYTYYKETGKAQFSAFEGWQMAANALYGYAHSSRDSVSSVPLKFRKLHAIVNRHMDSADKIFFFFRPDYKIGVYYLWDAKSPLKEYLQAQYGKDTAESYFPRWAAMAPLYRDYGTYLIEHHTGPFISEYIWPNLINYYVPPIGFMGSYNLERNYVDSAVVRWFRWKSNKVYPYFAKNTKIILAEIFPRFFGIINFIFVFSFIAFYLLDGFSKTTEITVRIIATCSIVWICNLAFSVVAAPIELRYQLFPMIFILCFTGLLLTYLIRKSFSNTAKETKSHQMAPQQAQLI